VSRITSLGYLLSPLRRRSVVEKWSPFEVSGIQFILLTCIPHIRLNSTLFLSSVFEGSIALFGKNFHRIQKYVRTKSVKEIIEFYYFWKKTSHYKQWKKTYRPDEREMPGFDEDKV
jgi:hypothetical protein